MERIGLARKEDVELVAKLYDSVNEYFEQNTNFCYPNWQKGKYPVLRDAQEAFEESTLYVLKKNGEVLGAIIINQKQHPEYKRMPWKTPVPDEQVIAVHTLVVDPGHRKEGLGEKLVQFCIEFCKNAGMKEIRLDTHYANIPARRLYEKCGFQSLGCQEAFEDGMMQKFDVFEYTICDSPVKA